MQITKTDVIWNYSATFLKIASSVLLFPLILRALPAETVGIWSIFITITSFVGLFDFGFNPSFARNVTYVFSGVRNLKVKGFDSICEESPGIDYGLLRGVITAMRWFYSRIAVVVFVLLITLGTYYIHSLLQNYKGGHFEVYEAWGLLCIINTYNLYTLHYDSLLQGKGLIKRSKQIIIIGQTAYLIIASILIMTGFGLVAIVSAQAASVIIVRFLSHRSFFTKWIKQALNKASSRPRQEIIQAIYPNALKVGLTSLGAFMVQKSAIVIGSLYLALEVIASYSITIQLISIIGFLASIYTATYQPKIVQLRVENNSHAIKEIYLRGQVFLILTYVAGGTCLLFFGNSAIIFIGSKTQLMPQLLIAAVIFASFLECNLSTAGNILLSKNEVPFFKASLFAGAATIVLLLCFFIFTNLKLWAMVLAPFIAQLYNDWKWPFEVIKQLNISIKDLFSTFINIIKIK